MRSIESKRMTVIHVESSQTIAIELTTIEPKYRSNLNHKSYRTNNSLKPLLRLELSRGHCPPYAAHLIISIQILMEDINSKSMFEKLDLPSNPTIQEIINKSNILDANNSAKSYILDEVDYSHRICIDTKRSNQIVSIVPDENIFYSCFFLDARPIDTCRHK